MDYIALFFVVLTANLATTLIRDIGKMITAFIMGVISGLIDDKS